MELRQRKVFPQKSEIFPAFFRQRCFLAEGILIDDISNYVMLSHVKAQKKENMKEFDPYSIQNAEDDSKVQFPNTNAPQNNPFMRNNSGVNEE